jgi:hypothetical protein
MTTQIQIKYKPKPNESVETELLRFNSPSAADKFLASILKNPDVAQAKKL